MSDLAEVESRIRAALERIGAGIDRLPTGGLPTGGLPTGGLPVSAPAPQALEEIAHLQAMLDAERAARADAEAALAEAGLADAPEPGDDRLLRQIDAQSLDNQRLRASVAALREEVRRLTEALAEGIADPALINHALAAEVEALRAQRASETTEMADILLQLDRIVTEGEAAHA